MKSIISLLAAVMIFFLPAGARAADIDIQAGLWEITMTMEMPGMPNSGQSMTNTQCITAEDQKDAKNVLPRGAEDCEVSDYQVSGNQVSWRFKCRQGWGNGVITFSSNSYSGTMNLTSTEGGEQQSVTMRFKGRRIGDCR